MKNNQMLVCVMCFGFGMTGCASEPQQRFASAAANRAVVVCNPVLRGQPTAAPYFVEYDASAKRPKKMSEEGNGQISSVENTASTMEDDNMSAVEHSTATSPSNNHELRNMVVDGVFTLLGKCIEFHC